MPSDKESGRQVKISFFGGLGFGRVGMRHETINLAALDDLQGHKLKVLLQRVEVKDYQDIVAILREGLTLERGMGAAMALFPNFPRSEGLEGAGLFSDGDLRALAAADRTALIDYVEAFSRPIETPMAAKRLAP